MAGRHSPQQARSSVAARRGDESSAERLQALGARAPALPEELVHAAAQERAHRVVRRSIVAGVVLVVLVLAGVQWFRPIAAPQASSSLAGAWHVPGAAPSLPWPTGASAALAVDGGPLLGHHGATTPVPIAGVAKVMTAFVVLEDHPLAAGADGPTVPVPADAVAAYHAGAAAGQSVVPLATGETLTERQALEGLVVASANDMADVLADWDAGSSRAMVGRLDAAAQRLGLASTTFADLAGIDPGTVSTPEDLVRLGQAVLASPTLRGLVAETQATLPLAGRVYNLDAQVGHGGFVGIKTGSDAAAGGCYLFAAVHTVAGAPVTLVGAVTGERTATPTASALADAATLVRAAFGSARPITVFTAGSVVGHVRVPWGPEVAVTERSTVQGVGWPGEAVPVRLRMRHLERSLPARAPVGNLDAGGGASPATSAVVLSRPLPGPGFLWRLTRL